MSLTQSLAGRLYGPGRRVRRLALAWGEELASLVPAGLRRRLRPSLTAEPVGESGFLFTRGGHVVRAPMGRRATPVTLRLPPGLALVSETTTPDGPAADIARVLALDLDRLTPFEPSEVFLASEVASRADGLGRRRVLLGAAPRGPVLDLIARCQSARLKPQALELGHELPGWPPLDLTGAVKERLAPGRDTVLDRLWLLVVLIAVLDLAVAVARDVRETQSLRQQIEVLRPRVAQDQTLRSRVLAEEARRAKILNARALADPLRVLDIASSALPDTAWADHFSWNGETLRLSGRRRAGLDVTAALRASPDLFDVRSVAADLAGGSADGLPFEVSARVRPPRGA
jgi:general secretion pathway protein L